MAVLPRFARWDNGTDDSSSASGASSNHGRSWVWRTCTSLCGDRIACARGGVLDLKRLTGASTIGQTPTLSRAGYGPGKRRAFPSKCAGYMMLLTEGLHCSGFAGSHLRLIIDLSTADDVNTSMCVFGASTKQHSWQSHLLIGFIDSKRT